MSTYTNNLNMESILDYFVPDPEELIYPNIDKGKYEILYANRPVEDDESMSVIQWLQGARIEMDHFNLIHTIDRTGKDGEIESVSFTMPEGNFKLGNLFDTCPYGIIKKNKTGIGATTLELLSKRNSIIVVPTKALAYNKAKASYNENSNKYTTYYIGSRIEGFALPQSIDEYLRDEEIEYKKFIVVADSLPRILNTITEGNFKNYFLMIDEIDSYQYDSTYRPDLENVIDYYFRFPYQKRCMVSATVGNFSNPLIQEEPVINVNFTSTQSRDIVLIHSNNVHQTLTNAICSLLKDHPEEKILIAFNSIRNIELIINKLSSDYQNECAVLCSPKSKPLVEKYYSEPIGNLLPKRINFMTCTYFVGIDISERFNLISVIDSKRQHTLLSTEKLKQIAGRCRSEQGVLSETIIYNTIEKSQEECLDLKMIQQTLLEDSRVFCDYANNLAVVHERFPYLNSSISRLTKEELINASAKSYSNLREIKLARTNINGNFVPAYFNIDAILIQLNLCKNLYNEQNKLHEILLEEGNNVQYKELREDNEDVNNNSLAQVDENHKKVYQNEIDQIIEELKKVTTIEEREKVANKYKMTATTHGSTFIERFLELQKYVPFDVLAAHLPSNDNPNKYKNFYNSVIFWALAEEHSFKIAIKYIFPIDSRFTSDEIATKMNDIIISNFNKSMANRQCVSLLKSFCKTSRVNDRNIGNCYKIISYDPYQFDCLPVNLIPASQNPKSLFSL